MNQKSFEMRMQSKQLEREAKKASKEALKQRNLAKKELARGNRAAAQLYAQNAIRYEQQANQLLQNCSAISSMATDINTAETTGKMAHMQSVATSELNQKVSQIDPNKVAAQRVAYDAHKSNLNAVNDIITNPEGQQDLAMGADNILDSLYDEIAMDQEAQLSQIPGQQFQIPTTVPGQLAPGMQ